MRIRSTADARRARYSPAPGPAKGTGATVTCGFFDHVAVPALDTARPNQAPKPVWEGDGASPRIRAPRTAGAVPRNRRAAALGADGAAGWRAEHGDLGALGARRGRRA